MKCDKRSPHGPKKQWIRGCNKRWVRGLSTDRIATCKHISCRSPNQESPSPPDDDRHWYVCTFACSGMKTANLWGSSFCGRAGGATRCPRRRPPRRRSCPTRRQTSRPKVCKSAGRRSTRPARPRRWPSSLKTCSRRPAIGREPWHGRVGGAAGKEGSGTEVLHPTHVAPHLDIDLKKQPVV